MARRMIVEQTSDAICVRPPTSPLMRDLCRPRQLPDSMPTRKRESGAGSGTYRVIEPYAGSVPGMNEPTRLPAPSATSSRFGLMECPKRAPFCLADTMLSRNPMMEITLQ